MPNELTQIDKKMLKAIQNGFNNDITLCSQFSELGDKEVFDIINKLALNGHITPLTSSCYMTGGEGRFPQSEHSIWKFDGIEVLK